jgi:spore coat polysaccharide biosynthesis protein SpsF (cytidylyltransferase family)
MKLDKVVAMIQARMGSTRFPGKVVQPVSGMPLLEIIIRRLRPARAVDELIVVTSTLEHEGPIVHLCEALGIRCFRGSEEDCLDRFYQAAIYAEADVIVRLTADNPFVDYIFLDQAVDEYYRHTCQYVSSALSGTYPYGLAVEVMSCTALQTAWREAVGPEMREHVTPFIYRNTSRFRTWQMVNDEPLGHLRFTVDSPEDLHVVRQIFAHFNGAVDFPWHAAVDLLSAA